MRAEPLPIDFNAEILRHQAQRARDRSSDPDLVHVSEIVKRMCQQADPKRFDSSPDRPFNPILAEMGFLWEDLLSEMFGRAFGGRQMSTEREGIVGTLDGFNAEEWRPREFKGTKISAANHPTSNRFWHWKLQTALYCILTGSMEAELYPLHLNGSYEQGGGRFGDPIVKPWLLQYRRQELAELWQTFQRWRDRILKERREARGR